MHRLLYISTSRVPITSGLLGDILTVSRRNNAANGVTGLLLAGGQRFLQVLEGELEAVHATYARICADPRHFATVQLAEGPTAERTFARWAMGSAPAGQAGVDATADAAVRQLIAPITDAALRGYFEGFIAVKRAA
jgi:hypothetical protein